MTLSPEEMEAVKALELPDDLRAPLHGLQADLDWIFGRMDEGNEVRGMLKDSIRNRLSQIEEAAYRLVGADALAAHRGERVAVPDGWKLVPIEPTEAMLHEGEGRTDFMLPRETHDNSQKGRQAEMRMAYQVMLAASPSPSSTAEAGWRDIATDAEVLDTAIAELLQALRKLTFAARTSGGTAGRDEALCAACDTAEKVIERVDGVKQ